MKMCRTMPVCWCVRCYCCVCNCYWNCLTYFLWLPLVRAPIHLSLNTNWCTSFVVWPRRASCALVRWSHFRGHCAVYRSHYCCRTTGPISMESHCWHHYLHPNSVDVFVAYYFAHILNGRENVLCHFWAALMCASTLAIAEYHWLYFALKLPIWVSIYRPIHFLLPCNHLCCCGWCTFD